MMFSRDISDLSKCDLELAALYLDILKMNQNLNKIIKQGQNENGDK